MTAVDGNFTASWNHRHRLRQSERESRRGIYNPHHSVRAFRVTGALDLQALDTAWRALQVRHPLLNSHFPDLDTWHTAPTTSVGLTTRSAHDRTAEAELRQAATAPFDVVAGPLARLIIVTVTNRPDQWLIALTADHIITDGWSASVMLRDLGSLYAHAVGADSDELPEIGRTHVDVVRRENEFLDSSVGRRVRRQICDENEEDGPLPDLTWPGKRERLQIRHELNQWFDRTLDAEQYDTLTALARSVRTTRLNLVLAAVHSALALLAGSDRIATTMTVANRAHPSVRESVGWFASKVVVASRPMSTPNRLDHVDQLRTAVAKSLDASRVPWPAQIYDHRPDRFGQQSEAPFLSFNAAPEKMNRRDHSDLLTGTIAEPISIRMGWQDAAIATQWSERGTGGLHMTLNYKTDVYTETDIESFWTTVVAEIDRLASIPVGNTASGRPSTKEARR